MNDKSKNAKRLNFHKGRQPRNPSQTNGTANVRINSEIAIPKLQELAHRYIGIIDAKGFLEDLRIALGIPNAKRVSKYGEIVVPKDGGSILKASLRITNHQANAGQHIKNNANYDYNLSIVVRRRARKNTFIPHNDVKLDEYVYYGKNISKVENPLTQIINSIIGFLQTGVYKDTTGVALKNTSPTNENKEYKTNEKMSKNIIRITENELNQIVAESVKKVLNEGKGTIPRRNSEIVAKLDSTLPNRSTSYLDTVHCGGCVIDGDSSSYIDRIRQGLEMIKSGISGAAEKNGLEKEKYQAMVDSIVQKVSYIMSNLRKHSYMLNDHEPWKENEYSPYEY